MIGFVDLVGTEEQIRVLLGAVPPPVLGELRDQAKASFEKLNPRS
jgi:hypothetical protein